MTLLKRFRIILPGIILMALTAAVYAYPWPDSPRVWSSIMAGPFASMIGNTRFDAEGRVIPMILGAVYLAGILLDPIKQRKWAGFVSATSMFIWFFTGLMVTIYYRA